ncbi:MAG: ribonuclease P protein component [Oscillospiraceae bacterium]|jgi:ribonuclease P protein component|nr:ribonuclease P protein component [Oscillospiraceae bacterium]
MGKTMKMLNKNRDFQRVYAKGKSSVSRIFVAYVLKFKGNENLIGITTSKKIGNAVKRNRARRVIKESYRQLEPSLSKGYVIVVVARGKTPFVKSWEVFSEMRRHFRKLGLLK